VAQTFADLHTHTTASDGLETPAELVQLASRAGLAAIAIADHDTVDAHLSLSGVDRRKITVIPAIEMSANVGTAEVHILGYFVDPTSQELTESLARLRRQRLRRVERFSRRLTEIGLPISVEQVLAHATGESVGRPHIARAMIDQGYVSSVNEAFDRYLSGGRPAFVPRDDVTPEWSIELIHAAGGVAVLAHPLTTVDPAAWMDRLIPLGLDGAEVEYGAYDNTQRAYLRELATSRGLIQTGGSDFHGAAHRENTPLGSGRVPLSVVDQIRDRSDRYRRT
jgi:predicted metal-dependent phosphoesterase TrpH